MTLAQVAAATIVALLVAATVFGAVTVAGRALRRAGDRRRTRLAEPARRLLLRLAVAEEGEGDPLVDELVAVAPAVWRAVEPAAVAMLGKVRGEAHGSLVAVFLRRGAGQRALRDLRARTAVRRARAAEVLGNLGERSAVPRLCDLLADADADVRVVAARALGRIGDPRAAPTLLAAVAPRRPLPPQVAAHALTRLGLAADGAVAAGLDHPDELVRATAAEVLGLLGAVSMVARVEAALRGDPSTQVRARAARTLGRIGTRSTLEPLLAAVAPDQPAVLCAAAAEALGELGVPAATPPLTALLADARYPVAHQAALALLKLGSRGRDALEAAAAADPDGAMDVRDLTGGTARAAAHAREALALARLDESRRAPVTASL